MEIKKEFEITYSYEYNKRLERRKKLLFFFLIKETLLKRKVRDESKL